MLGQHGLSELAGFRFSEEVASGLGLWHRRAWRRHWESLRDSSQQPHQRGTGSNPRKLSFDVSIRRGDQPSHPALRISKPKEGRRIKDAVGLGTRDDTRAKGEIEGDRFEGNRQAVERTATGQVRRAKGTKRRPAQQGK